MQEAVFMQESQGGQVTKTSSRYVILFIIIHKGVIELWKL